MNSEDIRILLIDDDKSYCKLVGLALERARHSAKFVVRAAHSLGGGLDLLKSSSFDLVLLDLNLPDS